MLNGDKIAFYMNILITNRCHMNCPHCMEDATPDGRHMTEETFSKVLELVEEAQPLVVNVSGGEPTENPLWEFFVKELLKTSGVMIVSLVTNGAWIEDKKTRLAVASLKRFHKDRFFIQVYSNPAYYQDHEWTVDHEAQFRSIGCIADFDSPIESMQDLGRARANCVAETMESKHVPSCINSHLLAVQSRSLQHFLSMAAQTGKVCRPTIDVDGGIHMSESRLCPSVAHVSDGAEEIFSKMRDSRPCKGCRLYKNFERLHPLEMKVLKL